jgi:hypothetical protein
VFVAVFIYDDDGSPTWYSGSGSMQNNSVAIDLQRYKGGPCLDCSYTPPQTNSIGKQLVPTFDASGSTATASLGGITDHIQRFNFKLGDGVKQLLGSWIITSLFPSGALGDRLVCNSIDNQGGAQCTGTSGGHGSIDPENGHYYGGHWISEAQALVYRFSFAGQNKIVGVSAIVDGNTTYEKAQSALDNSNMRLIGFRDK